MNLKMPGSSEFIGFQVYRLKINENNLFLDHFKIT